MKTDALEMFTHEPEAQTPFPDVLFIAGAGHTASCWDYLLPLFAKGNFRTHSFNFRGHGKSGGKHNIVNYRLQDYVDDLMSVVVALCLSERNYVIVAHSMGGYVAQVALQQGEMPGLVGIILLATLTPHLAGHPLVTLRFLTFAVRHIRASIQALQTRDFFSLISSQEMVKHLFFSQNTPSSTISFCQKFLQSDSFLVMNDVVHAPTPEQGNRISVPVQVIGASQDHIIPVSLLHKMATVYGVEAEIFDSGHDMMLDIQYPGVAAAIMRWIREKNAVE